MFRAKVDDILEGEVPGLEFVTTDETHRSKYGWYEIWVFQDPEDGSLWGAEFEFVRNDGIQNVKRSDIVELKPVFAEVVTTYRLAEERS